MTAPNGRLSASPGDASPGRARRREWRSAVLLGSLAAVTVLSGVMGLHALFGSFLSVFVIAAFYRRMRHAPPMQMVELRNFSRSLSRLVYLLLYVVFGAVLLANIPVWPTGDLRATLGYGIAALVMIRVPAAWLGLRLRLHRNPGS
jgi:cytochrome b561